MPLTDQPVIDAHADIGSFPGIDAPPLEAQIEEMDHLGVDHAIVSSTLAIGGEIERGNDVIAEGVARYPKHLSGYCHVSACYADEMLPELERCFATGHFKGIKLYQVGVPFDDPRFDPVWAFAEAHNAPILAHTWAGNVTGFDVVAGKHPDVTFLAGHSGSGFAYQPYIEMAKAHPNFILDLTYSREHTHMIEHMVREAGAEQVIWGSDVPTFSLSQQLAKILFARITEEEKKAIIHGNAARFFGMTGKEPYGD
jgi:predicted TIM-barrel fold metal-dependent hydrolase